MEKNDIIFGHPLFEVYTFLMLFLAWFPRWSAGTRQETTSKK